MATIEPMAAADQNTMRNVCRGPPRSTSRATERAITACIVAASSISIRASGGADLHASRSRFAGPSTRRIASNGQVGDNRAVFDDVEARAKTQRHLMLAARRAVEIDGGTVLHILHPSCAVLRSRRHGGQRSIEL